jgi:hypothetical protein
MVTDEMRRLARNAFALEVSQIERDVLLIGMTDDELESILDGILAAVAHLFPPTRTSIVAHINSIMGEGK